GSTTVTADQVIATDPDIACHVNGGPTSGAPEEIKKLVEQTSYVLELVHCGNPKTMLDAVNLGLANNCLHRFIIGNDAPSGTGVIPLGILRVMASVASLTEAGAAQAVCMATGNTARVHKLNRGIIAVGYEADLVAMDTPMGSVGKDALAALEAGDVPGVSMVMVDGNIVVKNSRNTPPAVRKAVVV
ncbi:MAG: amidohydrolase family protein, partial [Pseudomonadota bacterium]